MPATIPLLVPEMPTAAELAPWLERLDRDRRYTNFGPLAAELETRLAGLLAGEAPPPSAVAVCSATLALELSLQALGLAAGARVLVPSLTFPATALAIVRRGFVPVFVDVDPHSWCVDAGAVQAIVAKERVDALLPVAAFGRPLDVAAWDALARDTGLPLVVDAAGALANQPALRAGATVYSLHATKALSAGEGGLVLSHGEALPGRVRHLANFGFEGGVCVQPGTNAKLSEYHAAVGLASLARWAAKRERLKALRLAWREVLAQACPQVVLQQGAERIAASVLVVRLPDAAPARAVAGRLAGEGIETRRWYCPPLHRHPAFAAFAPPHPLPETERLGESLLGLPFHLELRTEDLVRVAQSLRAAVEACSPPAAVRGRGAAL